MSTGEPVEAETTLHARRRAGDMRHVQRCAIELFDVHGFDAVSVERVARAAGVSPVSVYRWFGAKEQLVLWDDYDPALFAAVAERLGDHAPLEAVRDAVVAELDRLYDTDRELVLARTQLLYREPALLAAALRDARGMRAVLVELFRDAGVSTSDFEREVLAEVAVGLLVASIDAWQRADGAVALADHVTAAFGIIGTRP